MIYTPTAIKKYINMEIIYRYYNLNRYIPFHCPDTSSIIPFSSISFKRSDALNAFMLITYITSDLLKIVCPINTSMSFLTWPAVLGWKTFSMSGFNLSISSFIVSMSGFSLSLRNYRLSRFVGSDALIYSLNEFLSIK